MKLKKILIVLTWLLHQAVHAQPVVLFDTTEGQFAVELFRDKAPATVENFLAYVRAGYYDGTLFHRVVSEAGLSIVQGGGYTQFDRSGVSEKPGQRSPIALEIHPDLSHSAYTLVMARQEARDLATNQFFINGKDNSARFDGAYAVLANF